MKKEIKKMDCIYRNRIGYYIEGKPGREEKLSFEDHLAHCPECMELVQLQKMLDGIIDEEKNIAPDPHLSDRIMTRIESSGKETGSTLVRILSPVAVTISVAAAIFAGVLIGNISAKPEVKPVPVELTLMDDIAMESVNILTNE